MSATDAARASESFSVRTGLAMAESGRHQTLFRVDKWDSDQIEFAGRRLSLPRGPRSGRLLVEPDRRHFQALRVKPFEVYEHEGSQFVLDTGWVMMMNAVAASAPANLISTTHGRIGLGTSATAVTHADTALGAIGALTTHNWEMLSANPTVGGTGAAGILFAATFPTGDANGVAIQEFGVDQGTAAALTVTPTPVFFEHGNATPGTKTNAQTWNVTVTITWS